MKGLQTFLNFQKWEAEAVTLRAKCAHAKTPKAKEVQVITPKAKEPPEPSSSSGSLGIEDDK